MTIQGGKRAKIIAAQTAEEFESKLNKELEKLDKDRCKYELTFNNSLGFCAYIVAEHRVMIPETMQDEFELAGEKHNCGDCPFWTKPTDGRVKYTRCEKVGGIHGANSPCCEKFYEMLFAGEIQIGGENND